MFYYIKQIYNYIRYNIPIGIKNIIKWFPIIWKDRDWDWEFLLEMMKFKMQLMEKCFQNSYISDLKKHAWQLHVCVLYIDRILKEEYYDDNTWTHGDYLKRQDLEGLFDMMKKHLFTWWE